MIFGIILIFLGLLLLLEMLIPGFEVKESLIWPLILLVIGIKGTIKERRLETINVILMFVGSWFFLLELGVLRKEILKLFWPLILIIIGITIIISCMNMNKRVKVVGSEKIKSAYYGIFGGTTEKITSKNFESANVYSVFGAAELDLSSADFKDKETVINVYSVFGGSEIRLPNNVNVKLNSTAVLGGNDNEHNGKYNAKNKTVILNCISVFGGTDIK